MENVRIISQKKLTAFAGRATLASCVKIKQKR